MPIKILAIGKKHASWIEDGIKRYETRIKRPFDVEWVILPHSTQAELRARQDESKRLLGRIGESSFVVLLDERGELLDSPTFTRTLLTPLEQARPVVIIIGGAYGVGQTIQNRANLTWSLSPLVFPHQLVRLLLVEQLYRAQEIANARPYHHI